MSEYQRYEFMTIDRPLTRKQLDEEKQDKDDNKSEDADHEGVPAVPPAFGALTEAQKTLAELLQVPQELLDAVARHSRGMMAAQKDDFGAEVMKGRKTALHTQFSIPVGNSNSPSHRYGMA